MKNLPAHEMKVGAIKATIWLNQCKDGKSDTYSVNISRSFKAGAEWKQSTSFSRFDLPKVCEILTKAEQWISLREPTVIAAI